MMTLLYPQDASECINEFFIRIEESSFIFTLLMFGFIAISTSYVFGTLLTANGNLWNLNLMAAVSVVINITLNIWLIPQMKASGAAIASLTAQSLAALVQVYLAFRILKIRTDTGYLIKILMFLIFVGISTAFVNYRMHNDMIKGILVLWLLGGVLAMIFKLLSVKELWEILTAKADASH